MSKLTKVVRNPVRSLTSSDPMEQALATAVLSDDNSSSSHSSRSSYSSSSDYSSDSSSGD